MRGARGLSLAAVAVVAAGCAHTKPATVAAVGPEKVQEVRFEDLVITGDLELEKLNDEELFAQGTSAYAAGDFAQAARFFDRICDFHPNSKHRREAMYNAGLSHEKLKQWHDAWARFSDLADPVKGQGDALDAAFRVAEVLYHLEKYTDAVAVLKTIADREDVKVDSRLEARVQQGVCELESGQPDVAEATLRQALAFYQGLPDRDMVDEFFPGQAQFFLGEIFRQHYESVDLDPNKGTEKLAEELEYKSELLLSSQGHYLRCIRMGNAYWATAAGQRIGGLYESMYNNMMNAPAPNDLAPHEQDVYRSELRKKIRVLITKAITVYERTLEAAERIGAASPFVEETRASLQRMKDLLVAEARAEEEEAQKNPEPPPPPAAAKKKVPRS